MKLGVGLYRYMLKDEEFAFARQCGCTDLIVHLANYYNWGKGYCKSNRMKKKIMEHLKQMTNLEFRIHDDTSEKSKRQRT